MLKLFAATGHCNYAKSVRLYLEQMSQLPTDHPWLYNKFMQEGCHSVSRSSRIWSGLSTDLTIEQTMMRAIKGRSGLTHVNCLMLFRLTSLFWCVSLWKKECITVRSSIAQITNPSNVMFIMFYVEYYI